MASPVRVKGHAYKGLQTNVYGDHRYVCECGDTGFPLRSEDDVRTDHRGHKRRVIVNGADPMPRPPCTCDLSDLHDPTTWGEESCPRHKVRRHGTLR